jgi:uncharacterized protein YqeY
MLLERIKADRLVAMKARDARRRDLLGTLAAAATKERKDPDDAEVLRTLRSFLKSLDETTSLLRAKGADTSAQEEERAILEGYLPATLGEAELDASIAEILATLPERSPKAMGQVMAALKARHGEALDARAASARVKAALT